MSLPDGTSYTSPECPGTAFTSSFESNHVHIEYTSSAIASGNWLTRMTASWTVPVAPADAFTSSPQQYVSVWPGLEPATGAFVLQPVLFYGFDTGLRGGNHWSFGCYLAYRSDLGIPQTSSQLITVNPGDTLTGSLVASNCSSTGVCTWTCTATDTSTGQSVPPWSSNLTESLIAAYNDLEVNNLDSCFEFPENGPSVISNIALYDNTSTLVTPSWDTHPNTQPFDCGFSVSATANSATLGYKGAVCTPGVEQSCCAYPQGCSCAGTQTCNTDGQWGVCIGSSPIGSQCR